MIKKHQVLLLAPLAVLVPVLLYHLNPPDPSPLPASPNTVSASPETFTHADFAKHVEQLKKKLPSNSFTVIIQRPFVVIGDESAADVKKHSEQTVKWAVDKLQQDFFAKDPKEILATWLVRDATSYEKNALVLFGETPTTPYGYYSSAHKALIMNISTGGGTLVHDIINPLLGAHFSACAPLFH